MGNILGAVRLKSNFEWIYFTIVTGAFALCEIKVEVLPKKISFGKPSPREPITI